MQGTHIRLFLLALICVAITSATFKNPLFEGADPGILFDPQTQTYYVAVTGGSPSSGFFPISASTDLVHWTKIGWVFPPGTKPSWSQCDSSACTFWAPEIHIVGNKYVVYFAASATSLGGKNCVGAAWAYTAAGPYTDIGHCLVDDPSVGLIDPSYFYDATKGTNYLLWKLDGNSLSPPVPCVIYIQPLASNGLSLTGSKSALIKNDVAWEGEVVEGPWMVQEGSYYYLFFAGNAYCNSNYALGVARSTSITSGFEKFASNPILRTGALYGPGHSAIIQATNGGWMVMYAAWVSTPVCGADKGSRWVCQDNMTWKDGWPVLEDGAPSKSPQTPPGPPCPMQQPEACFAEQPDGRLVLAATTQLYGQELLLSVQPSNTSSAFSHIAQLSNGTGVSVTAATNADGRVELMALGTAKQALFRNYQLAVSSSQWSGWVPMSGAGHSVRMATGADGRLYAVFTDQMGSPYYTNSSSWVAPTPLSGTCLQIAVGVHADGLLDVMCIGDDYKLKHNWQTNTSSSTEWSGWYDMPGIPTGIIGYVAVTSNKDGRLEVFFTVGSYWGGAVYHTWQESVNGNWTTAAVDLNKGTMSHFAVAQDAKGCLVLVGVSAAPAYNVYHIEQETPGGAWDGWTAFPESKCMQVALHLDGLGMLQVGCVGTNSAVYAASQTATGWGSWVRL